MSDKTWKAVERKIAKYLGTRRTPLSGGNDGRTRSDSLHPLLFVEVKHGASAEMSWAKAVRLFREVQEKADEEDKMPVLILHRKGRWGGIPDYPAIMEMPHPILGNVVVQVPLSAVKAIVDGAAGTNAGSASPPKVRA